MKNLEAAVWRELGRHAELAEGLREVRRLLSRALPLKAIWIRQLEPSHRVLATVVAEPAETLEGGPSVASYSPAQWRRLLAWGMQTEGLIRLRPASPEARLLTTPAVEGELLAGVLRSGDEVTGVLLLASGAGRHFSAEHRRLAVILLDPLSVALANTQRIHDLAALREAAEAERQTLLARLGRTDLTESIVGAEGGLKLVMQRVALVSRSDAPVLLLGETGTGKEVVARAVHLRSARHQGPFIRVNCGAIPSELIDSQLFGHEKGSFTGAAEMRQGWFERADGGTLFLDEIGELPLAAQVRLLRVLQDGYLERVGGQQPVRVDVRIVAATHRNLPALVETKEFREDLWYRLAVFPILLPPLRERLEDIPDLAQHFAERAAARFGLPVVMPSPRDIQLLAGYAWPGNVRELGAVIDRAAILGDGKTLEIANALGTPTTDYQPPTASLSGPTRSDRPTSRLDSVVPLEDAIQSHIERALHVTQGRIEGPRGAAALLHINPHTLRSKMRKLGIDWDRFRS